MTTPTTSHQWAKYFLEFAAVFIGVVAAFGLEEWRDQKQEKEETLKALNLIKLDLERDTSLYHFRLDRIIDRNIEYLKLAEQGESISVEDFRKVHKALRSGSEYKVFDYGYNYLRNNIRFPRVKNDSALMWIGYYYTLSSPEGNYGRHNAEYQAFTYKSYKKLFEYFPHFFHQDTVMSNAEIRKNIPRFFDDPYWQARIPITERELSGLIKAIFEKNLHFAEHLLKFIEKELED